MGPRYAGEVTPSVYFEVRAYSGLGAAFPAPPSRDSDLNYVNHVKKGYRPCRGPRGGQCKYGWDRGPWGADQALMAGPLGALEGGVRVLEGGVGGAQAGANGGGAGRQQLRPGHRAPHRVALTPWQLSAAMGHEAHTWVLGRSGPADPTGARCAWANTAAVGDRSIARWRAMQGPAGARPAFPGLGTLH